VVHSARERRIDAMMAVPALVMLIPLILIGGLSVALTVWVLLLFNRAVRALESIADALHRRDSL